MTACAPESSVTDGRTARHSTFTIAADGAYAARLNASAEDGWFPERWTLDGPEPYAVPLPGSRPEQSSSQVLPLTDGRVLIARRESGAHRLALLYPTGPSTGELSLGAVESERLTLLPPAPCGRRAYGLTVGEHSTGVWQVAGGEGTPRLVAEVPGRCGGGAWLDREGRLLAVDRTDTAGTGRTKTVAVDLGRGGEVSPLLQITDESDDLLLLADPDSGLLIVRSDAPGEFRLGWGVLGSHRPVRFPECLHPEGALLTPFAVQPGQMLLPESCAVALHGQTTGARAGGAWLGVWRPMQKELRRFRAPGGWLPGKGVWTREGELRLPCASAHAPCGLARLRMRSSPPHAGATVAGTGESIGAGMDLSVAVRSGAPTGTGTADAGGPAADPDPAADAGSPQGGSPREGSHPDGSAGGPAPAPSSTSGSASTPVSEAGLPGGAEAGAEALPDGSLRRMSPSEPAGGAQESPPGPLPPEVPPKSEAAAPEPREAAPSAPAQAPVRAPVPAQTGTSGESRPAGAAPGSGAGQTAAGSGTAPPAGAQPPSTQPPTAQPPTAQPPTVEPPSARSGPSPSATAEGAAPPAPAPPTSEPAQAPPPPVQAGPSAAHTSAAASAAQTAPAAAASAGSSLPVTEPCVRRKPVPLQDAPLATALHDAVVRARTA